ncbi:MAG: hypothetical protein ACRD2J_05010 [Thermoanaerobaculia bacterium]
MEKPNLLLTGSSIIYLAGAIPLLFAPAELLAFAGAAPTAVGSALLQVVGAANLGFAMLAWMTRYATIGGIFGRPIVVAHLAYTASAALLLLSAVRRAPAPPLAWGAVGIYALLAIGFGARLLGGPSGARRPSLIRRGVVAAHGMS